MCLKFWYPDFDVSYLRDLKAFQRVNEMSIMCKLLRFKDYYIVVLIFFVNYILPKVVNLRIMCTFSAET